MDLKKLSVDLYVITILTILGIFAFITALIIAYPALAYLSHKLTM